MIDSPGLACRERKWPRIRPASNPTGLESYLPRIRVLQPCLLSPACTLAMYENIIMRLQQLFLSLYIHYDASKNNSILTVSNKLQICFPSLPAVARNQYQFDDRNKNQLSLVLMTFKFVILLFMSEVYQDILVTNDEIMS